MARRRHTSYMPRGVYNDNNSYPADDEGSEAENIYVGGKSGTHEPKSKRMFGDIRYWLADRRRRESVNGTLSESKNNQPPRPGANSRNTSTHRRVVSHVEIVVPRHKPSAQPLTLLAQHQSSTAATQSPATDLPFAMPRKKAQKSDPDFEPPTRRTRTKPNSVDPPGSSSKTRSNNPSEEMAQKPIASTKSRAKGKKPVTLPEETTTSASSPHQTQSRSRRSLKRVNYVEPVLELSDDEMPDYATSAISDGDSSVVFSNQSSDNASDLSNTTSDVTGSEATGSDPDSEPKPKRQKTSRTTSKSQADKDAKELTQTSTPPSQDVTSNDTGDNIMEPKRLRSRKNMTSLCVGGSRGSKEINQTLPPLSAISDIFLDITEEVTGRKPKKFLDATSGDQVKFQDVIKHLNNRPLRVATMCSGTESPILALQMIKDSLEKLNLPTLQLEHVFSAEIVPYKQAYIERNFRPPILFRNINEITKTTDNKATTAYGARVTIPDRVDIVIAGTACVDFSNLNNKKKALEDLGESGDTFIAVYNYAMKYRPAILLLENVMNAPWDLMIHRYQSQGYVCTGVLVDTKDFYLPQTRQRGYMVCFDGSKLETSAEDSVRANFVQFMRDLKRPVTSPVSSFLLPDDDVNVIRSRHSLVRQSRLDGPVAESDWAKCELRHIHVRQHEKLGNARPLTDWQESGVIVVPEHCDKQWFKKQVERVWDFADISFLRNAAMRDSEPYDSQYKSRIWNVSQNIDRANDSAPFGISPCLTPSGSFWLTHRGGPLTYTESLTLQGLPLDKISFTTETERHIQDLAGNAMSTTVVGSAILSALMSGYSALTEGSENNSEDGTVIQCGTIVGVDELEEPDSLVASDSVIIDLDSLLEDAEKSVKKCHCEGRAFVSERPIQTCKDCDHSACIPCAGKPSHNFDDPEHVQRHLPEAFIQKWKSKVPMIVQFKSIDRQKFLSQIDDQVYVKAVLEAASKPLGFKEFRRTSHWILRYESPLARLDLILNRQCFQWEFSVKPASSLAGNNPLRILFQRPIARALATKDAFFGKDWEWRLPMKKSSNIQIQGQGKSVPSWFARIGLEEKQDSTMPSSLNVHVSDECLTEDISGTYTYLPNCGTACESLYKRTKPEGLSKMYLFLDPTLIQNPKDDKFVFAADKSRLPHDQTRETVAVIESSWRPWNHDDAKTTKVQYDVWRLEHECSLTDTSFHPLLKVARGSLSGENCSAAKAVVSLDFQMPFSDVEKRFIGHHQIQSDDKAFFDTFGWALQTLQGDLFPGHEHHCRDHVQSACNTCAPKFPGYRWNILEGKRSKDEKKINVGVRPYEDPETATNYEVSLKKRPQVFVIEMDVERDSQGASANLRIGMNALSLCHRALGKLRRLSDAPGSASWTLDTQWFDKLAETPPVFTLQNNSKDTALKATSINLFYKQQQSLGWMKQQEQGSGPAFTLEEVDEALLSRLGWRLEARASATIHVKGGILADHAGFGKTVVSLALISSDFDDDQATPDATQTTRPKTGNSRGKKKQSPPTEPKESCKTSDLSEEAGREEIKATLIICPPALVDQWREEVAKFLGEDYTGRTITIKNIKQLEMQTIEDFRKARIIIVTNQIWQGSTYLTRLAEFTGMPECSSNGARELKAWLELAAKSVLKSLRAREKSLSSFGEYLQRSLQEHLKDGALRAFAKSSKRLKGKQYIESKESDVRKKLAELQKDDFEEDLVPSRDFTKRKLQTLRECVLFEMFTFNRLIIDEFSYLRNKEIVWYSAINADKRWGLSATPQLKDPFDVSRMARLLGINLPIGASAPGLISDKNARALREGMTNLELFETYRDPPSFAVQKHVHGLSQKFLDTFVRQNVMEFEDFPYDDWIFPLRLNADHRLAYTDLSQKLNSQDMRVRKRVSKKSDPKDSKTSDNKGSKKSDNKDPDELPSAESELVMKAAFFDATKRDVEITVSSEESADVTPAEPADDDEDESQIDGLSDECDEDDDNDETSQASTRQASPKTKIEVKTVEGAGLTALVTQCTDSLVEAKTKLQEVLDDTRDKALLLRSEKNFTKEHCPLQNWAHMAVTSNVFKDHVITNELQGMIGLGNFEVPAEEHQDATGQQTAAPSKAKKCEKTNTAAGAKGPKRGSKRKIGDAKNNGPKQTKEASTTEKKRIEGIKKSEAYKKLRDSVSGVNRQARAWAAAERSLRFVSNAFDHVARRKANSELLGCSGERCTVAHHSAETLSLSAACGHIICDDCYEYMTSELGICRAKGCSMLVKSYHLLRLSKLGDDSYSKHGKKADHLFSLLHDIARKDEQAILFIQYDKQIQQMVGFLEKKGIKCSWHGSKLKGSRNFINEFQSPMDPKNKATVLILNSSDVSAAGTNLVGANHVIFFSPLLVETQYQYDAQMAQAIGRVRRPGQQKGIHVYRLTALDTIDVDLLEQRERRTNILPQIPQAIAGVNSDKPAGDNMELDHEPLDFDTVPEPEEPERTQLIRDYHDDSIKLVPKSILLAAGGPGVIEGKTRVKGYEEFNSLIKFSRAFADDD